MADILFEAAEPAAIEGMKPASTSKTTKPARQSRLQIELLEKRDLMAGDAESASSDVMNASAISAFFEQSALYSSGHPTTDPTVTWTNRDEYRQAQLERPANDQRYSAVREPSDLDTSTERRRVRSSELLYGQGGRSAGSSKRLLRHDAAWPRHVFVPYVDLSATPDFDLARAAETEGLLYFNLAYVTADSQNRPSWCGSDERAIDGGAYDQKLRAQIRAVRALGGDVAVSFGGPQGADLAQALTNVEDLKIAYRSVVDAYGLKRVDFDLSEPALQDAAAVERRTQAIRGLQRELAQEGHPLEVWYTLPAESGGLSRAGLNAVESAVRGGVELSGVNLKSGGEDDSTRHPRSTPGVHTIEATINSFYQLRKLLDERGQGEDAWSRIGITPTVGKGNDATDTFEARDAWAVLDFARQQGAGMIGIWSLNSDRVVSTENNETAPSSPDSERSAALSDILRSFTDLLAK